MFHAFGVYLLRNAFFGDGKPSYFPLHELFDDGILYNGLS